MQQELNDYWPLTPKEIEEFYIDYAKSYRKLANKKEMMMIDIENDFGKNLLAYPNPTSGKMVIDLDASYSYIKTKILNVAGTTLSVKEFSNLSRINLEVEGAPGYYFIEIEGTGNKRSTIKILKE